MEYEKAKEIAAKLLSYKMYTCQEVLRRLSQKGISEETAEMVVGDFCKAGILNDEEYASLYIHDGISVNMKGLFRIKQELMKKGVAQSIIEKAMANSEIDQKTKLKEYVEIRFEDKIFEDWKELEKAKAHLVRRGFGLYDINKCFDDLGIKVSKREDDEV